MENGKRKTENGKRKTVAEVTDPDIWNPFAAAYPGTDFMQSWEWGELKARGEWQPRRLILWEEDRPVAGASVLFRPLPGGWTIAYAPRGPLIPWSQPEQVGDFFSALRQVCRRNRAVFLKIDPAVETPSPAVEQRLTQTGFRPQFDPEGFGGTQPKCVMRLDLTPDLEGLLAACKEKTRYNIRLAGRKGVTVEPEGTLEGLRDFYTLLQETARRDGFVIRGYSYYQDLWELFIQPDQARLFVARYEGKTIAGGISFIFGDTCWYVYGASSNDHRNVMPNYAVQWAMISWARERGCRIYDFRGVSQRNYEDSQDPLYGLNRFKAGFSPRFVEWIGEYDWPFSPILYPLWTSTLPRVRNWMKRRRGQEEMTREDK